MFQLHVPVSELPLPLTEFKAKALHWADSFAQVAYYEPNQIAYPYQGFDNFLAVSNSYVLVPESAALTELAAAARSENILCCILSYELKNQVEALTSQNQDKIQFPLLHFFKPQVSIHFINNSVKINSLSDNCLSVLQAINEQNSPTKLATDPVKIYPRLTKDKYLEQVRKVQQCILDGDVYELNFCQEFYAEKVNLNPVAAFISLNILSPMPFAGFYKTNNRYLLCASPERFLKRTGQQLISQPIKGTIRRGTTPAEDAQLQNELATNEKEIAENMMIMDLVRNDLARCSRTGSVKVTEMFKIYPFRQVFQMITTVTSLVKPELDLAEILQSTFPMGSMTGAPKVRALELIDQYESFARGLFSGSLGYILPNGDFDFNVVIRSIQYNAASGYVSFAVGSAITFDSDPEKEYEECLLKAQAIVQILK